MSDPYKILIIDDEPTGRLLMAGILQSEGYEVYEEESPEKAIEKALELKPDLIISDVSMPEMNGFEFVDYLRNQEETFAVPIMFITGLTNRFGILKALRIGADDYIVKPVEKEDLINRVNHILSKQSLLRDKVNLLRVNEAVLDQIQVVMRQLSVVSTVEEIKKDIAKESESTLDFVSEARRHVEDYNEDAALEALDKIEMSLQFADRTSQQLNEFAKMLDRIHRVMCGDRDGKVAEIISQASSDSVLTEKVAQEEVDDLIDSLGI